MRLSELEYRFVQAETVFMQAVSINDSKLKKEYFFKIKNLRTKYCQKTGKIIDRVLVPPGMPYEKSKAYKIREEQGWPHPSEL